MISTHRLMLIGDGSGISRLRAGVDSRDGVDHRASHDEDDRA